ncbi:putative squamosa promoter-binding-like protein [Helianthus annuus]|nr:putative squamosa promoter-binding-like protein [Helianthus annuus]KAJ0498129.1 putative squamosa promoter-binding-like protein [Helianthus annuus]KAJ0664131.1 putative squamosa promoter-binding-like protein [Helianthus annuus]KAJ0671614.1 putative squamosa promoter-binding-like protein [Helianthus annuus]
MDETQETLRTSAFPSTHVKWSCHQRLSDHNARRRKPQKEKETIHFNSRSQSSSFYDGQHQIRFVPNNVPDLVQTEPVLNSIWETTRNSQHTAGVFHQAVYFSDRSEVQCLHRWKKVLNLLKVHRLMRRMKKSLSW